MAEELHRDSSASANINNSIVWGNSGVQLTGGPIPVAYSNVEGGADGINISLNPQFVDMENGDLRLTSGSPSIDAANNNAVPSDVADLDGDRDTTEPIPFDLDGNPRLVDDPVAPDCPQPGADCGTPPIVDMGAYERVNSPACDAGGSYVVECGGGSEAILLDGSGSTPGVPGAALSFAWVTDCPNAILDDPASMTPLLTIDPLSACPLDCGVVLTVTEVTGTSMCQASVTVTDTINPEIGCPLNAAVACGESTDPLATGSATATDGCDTSVAVGFADVEDLIGCSGTGTITRTWTATDDCGNNSACDQVIAIEDLLPPVINGCPSDINIICAASQGQPVVFTEPLAIDACDAAPSVVCTPPSGALFPIGITVVTCEAEDACSNTSDPCIFDVTLTPCGSCCDPSGTCAEDIPEADCTSGAWVLEGTCVPNPCPAPPSIVAVGSRYLELTPVDNGAAIPVALRLTSPDLPCLTKYVVPDACLSVANAGTLIDFPVSLTPSEWGTILLADIDIVPDTTYTIQAENMLGLSGAASATTWRWGDVNQDIVPNFADIFLIVLGFQSNFESATLQATDIHPCEPNCIVNFGDVFSAVLAFQGAVYSDVCPTPCE